jgi:anaerobic selenocysteine-containing dehydrogenase
MNRVLHHLSRRALLPALGLALTLGAIGLPAQAAHAEPNSGFPKADPGCKIPGSDIVYVTGEKATFSKDGQPAKEHTCQKDGTWSDRVVAPPSRFPGLRPIGGVYVAH